LILVALIAWPVGAAEPEKAGSPQAQAAKDKPPDDTKKEVAKKPDSGDTAWMLVSTAFVMLMVPGLALFYGGMARRKNVLGTMMHSMVALGLIGIQWVLFGYSLAFGISQGGLIGWNPDYVGLNGVTDPNTLFPGTNIPVFVHCMYQGMFAIITPALISGAIAERVRFGPYCLFILLWAVLVYDPLAHWVWAVNAEGKYAGWLGANGALDFAGGTVVHISAGFSALAAILLLRKRKGYPERAMHPNSMVLTLVGGGLLWFGWFGFNGGSGLASGAPAAVALAATQVAAGAASLSWLLVEWLHKGKPTALGFASGLVAGLVAVTPASGFVTPLSALLIGLIAGVVCYGAVSLKPALKYDDAMDAFGVHGIGGLVGAILTGVFASAVLFQAAAGNTDPVGKLADGRGAQISMQVVASVVSIVYAFVISAVLVLAIDKLWGFTVDSKAEEEGLDRSEHGEVGFDLGLALEMAAPPAHEPRPADVPPNGRRHFTVVVEGAKPRELIGAWSEMCGGNGQPPTPEFRRVYPYVTTVQGNRFNFRGGDPPEMRETMKRLFQDSLQGAAIQTHVEN
jgi:Amt family ammonium transporter